MKVEPVARALPRLILAVTILCVACSDGPKSSLPNSAPLATPTLTPQSTSAAVSASPDAGSALVWPDHSWAAATQVGPGAQCTVSASNDPSRTRTIQAADDGYVRFYLPSPAWGTKLTLDCTSNGGSKGHYAVDLNDTTTFTRQSGSDLEPTFVRTQPALTGDVSAISQDDLRRQVYPPRPEPTANPTAYSQWLQSVSRPATIVQQVPVADLDSGFGFFGQCNDKRSDNTGWTGISQAAAGFASTCIANANKSNSNSEFYIEYVMYTDIPSPLAFGCVGQCQTGIWAGLGGWVIPQFPNGTSLPQHGFAVYETTVNFMWEWAVPGASPGETSIDGYHFNAGDAVELAAYGVSSNSCGATISTVAPWFCFLWFDLSTNYYAGITLANPSTSNAPWYPNTFEFIGEVSSGGWTNAPFGEYNNGTPTPQVEMIGWAYDFNGNTHYDDGNTGTGDPYVYNQAGDLNNGFWEATGKPGSPPENPWILQWDNAQ